MRVCRTSAQALPLATLFHAPTIEQLAHKLRPQATATSYATLVAIQPGGFKPPFFCVHGGAGSALFLHRLAREMGPDQPFYGIEPEGLDGKRFQRTTVEQMAAHYLAEIRKIQPEGPYYIGGYCFGGLTAFEMARQLRRQGQQVAVVALFSASLRFYRAAQKQMPAAAVAPKSRTALTRLMRLVRSPRQTIGWRVVSWTRTLQTKVRRNTIRLFLALGLPVPQALRTMYVTRMLSQAEENYAPGRYDGTLILFRGQGLYENDPDMGWDGLADNFENYEIGDGGLLSRRDIMNEPLVGLLAKQLSACLERARDVGASSCRETKFDRSVAASSSKASAMPVIETAG